MAAAWRAARSSGFRRLAAARIRAIRTCASAAAAWTGSTWRVLVGLVLFAFLFRLWRLDTPRSMHFDEVYHARSATEWLADWQEGWTRDTYEWTHPMLAKYLIAAGIVVADPNKVVGRDVATGAPYSAMAVASQRQADGHRRVDRLRRRRGRTITARTVLGGEVVAEWQADGEVASLAYDPDNDRLLVGLADSGHGRPPTTRRLPGGHAARATRRPQGRPSRPAWRA